MYWLFAFSKVFFLWCCVQEVIGPFLQQKNNRKKLGTSTLSISDKFKEEGFFWTFVGIFCWGTETYEAGWNIFLAHFSNLLTSHSKLSFFLCGTIISCVANHTGAAGKWEDCIPVYTMMVNGVKAFQILLCPIDCY